MGLGYEMMYVPRDTVASGGGLRETGGSLPRERRRRQQWPNEVNCRRADTATILLISLDFRSTNRQSLLIRSLKGTRKWFAAQNDRGELNWSQLELIPWNMLPSGFYPFKVDNCLYYRVEHGFVMDASQGSVLNASVPFAIAGQTPERAIGALSHCS